MDFQVWTSKHGLLAQNDPQSIRQQGALSGVSFKPRNRSADARGMRLIKLAVATMATGLGLFCLTAGVIGAFDYASCRGSLGDLQGRDRTVLTWACNYDLRIALWAITLATTLGVLTFFLLRGRWRNPGPAGPASG